MVSIFMFFLSSAEFFQNQLFPPTPYKKMFMSIISVSNGLGPDVDRQNASPDLGPNNSQRLSADDKVAVSKQ